MPLSVSTDIIPETSPLFSRNNFRGKRSSKKRPRARRTASDKTSISVTDAGESESSIDQRLQTNPPTTTPSDPPSRYGTPPDSSSNTVLKATKSKKKVQKKKAMATNSTESSILSASSAQSNDGSASRRQPVSSSQEPQYTVTLVKGEYIRHLPGNLHEPLNSGFMTWAHSQRTPQTSLTARWHNRLLQFWRLSTDAARFDRDEGSRIAPPPPHPLAEFAPLPQRPYPSQRPYTAPAHQSEE